MLAVFIAALTLYAVTAPHTVALEDDALFIGTLHFFGVAHPPGYPLHTLLGGIIYHLLPFGSPAYKAHIVSALFGAGAAAAVYAVTALLTSGRLTPLCAALLYTVSEAFWSQAIIAEVYTLNALLFFLLLALTLDYISRQSRRTVWLIAVVAGLGLANHYPLFILAATAVAVYLFWHLPDKLRSSGSGIAITFVTAAVFYLWMIARSYDTTMPAHFYGIPLDTAEQFFYYLLRRGYTDVDYTPGVTWQDKLTALHFIGKEALIQYTPVGAVMAVIGFVALWRQQRQVTLVLLTSLFSVSILLIIVRDFNVSQLDLAVFRVYHLTSYGIMAIATACGIRWLAARLTTQHRGQLTAATAILLISATAASHWRQNDRSDYRWAEDLARAKLNTVSPGATLFVGHDFDSPIGYLHYILGERPDIALFHIHGLIYGNPLYHPFIPTTDAPAGQPSKKDILNRLVDSSNRPVFFAPEQAYLFDNEQRHSDLNGFYQRRNNLPYNRIRLAPTLLEWVKTNLDIEPTDDWTRIHQHGQIQQIIAAVLLAQWNGQSLTPDWQPLIEEAREHNVEIDLMLTEHALVSGTLTGEQAQQKIQLCRMPPAYIQNKTDQTGQSNFYLFCAKLAWHLYGEQDETAEHYLEQALRRPAILPITTLTTAFAYYQRRRQPCRILSLAEQISTMPPAAQPFITDARVDCSDQANTTAPQPKNYE